MSPFPIESETLLRELLSEEVIADLDAFYQKASEGINHNSLDGNELLQHNARPEYLAGLIILNFLSQQNDDAFLATFIKLNGVHLLGALLKTKNGLDCLDYLLGKFSSFIMERKDYALAVKFHEHFYPIITKYKVELSKALLAKYAKDFKLCDLDGVVLKFCDGAEVVVNNSFDQDCVQRKNSWQGVRKYLDI